MEINFTGKYKSITSFTWTDIPEFVVITGPNRTGKSQLLDLIYNTLINKRGTTERVQISGKSIQQNEVILLLKGVAITKYKPCKLVDHSATDGRLLQ
ncbi:MAG: hypothetical protein IPO92_00035 [Saprospiraceae bacterium]|nr:hypothetical protein [Saprospiraceae bacterium]